MHFLTSVVKVSFTWDLADLCKTNLSVVTFPVHNQQYISEARLSADALFEVHCKRKEMLFLGTY